MRPLERARRPRRRAGETLLSVPNSALSNNPSGIAAQLIVMNDAIVPRALVVVHARTVPFPSPTRLEQTPWSGRTQRDHLHHSPERLTIPDQCRFDRSFRYLPPVILAFSRRSRTISRAWFAAISSVSERTACDSRSRRF